MKAREAADLLGVSLCTLHRWIILGRIKGTSNPFTRRYEVDDKAIKSILGNPKLLPPLVGKHLLGKPRKKE
jgi:predicted site-specific integrase-resolvase